ncbi:dipeptidyl peptidase 3 isoform X4 [Mirounga angustirostris]|uniref:dipeptidyl peptidase 3 isoform X4 n=1 Tax=Mirounga angustirostris TaxID=9716 RepID=UPI00313F22C9
MGEPEAGSEFAMRAAAAVPLPHSSRPRGQGTLPGSKELTPRVVLLGRSIRSGGGGWTLFRVKGGRCGKCAGLGDPGSQRNCETSQGPWRTPSTSCPMTSVCLAWTAGRPSVCCHPQSASMPTICHGLPGMEAWLCCCRPPLRPPTSMRCSAASSVPRTPTSCASMPWLRALPRRSISSSCLAGWGQKTGFLQKEAETVFQLGFRAHTERPREAERVLGIAGTKAFLVYAAGVYSNMGNYKSFGDTKFVPNLPKEKLERVILGSEAAQQHPEEVRSLWQTCRELMFSLEPRLRHLGLGKEGITTYFSGDCTMEDAKLAQDFLDSQNLSAYNTRLFKGVPQDGKPCYEVRLASVLGMEPALHSEMTSKLKSYEFQGSHFQVTRGDYAPILQKVVEHLEKAKAYAANSQQEQMLAQYIESFTQGSIEAHKRGSRFWIQDKGPIVESYIGFIESYRDPFGSRGEFEGFVAMVNKAMSAKFECLVASAEQLLKELPWPPTFEKDKFLAPDFTSLDVLTFSGSGIPAGINIPNYDDLRQTDGFKTVSLGNVLAVAYATQREKLTFLEEEDKDLFIRWKGPSFDVQVGLHELLGHGSGKLFVQAHMQARFVILRVLLEAGEGLVTVTPTTGADGRPDARVRLDRNKIRPVGKPALERFLRKLQVLKSTGDVAGGRALYEGYAAVTDASPECFLTLRDTVLLRKESRKLIVQPNTRLEGSEVQLLEYEASAAGLIRSFSERFPEDGPELEEVLTQLATADARFWKSPSEAPSGQA